MPLSHWSSARSSAYSVHDDLYKGVDRYVSNTDRYFPLFRSLLLNLSLDTRYCDYSSSKFINMKAQCDLPMSAAKHMEQKLLKGRVSKDRDVTQEEMQSLLLKLKTLVPNMPRNKKLSKLEIIQYVIDYILDLQIALETHPAATRPATNVLTGINSNRQPLGVLSPSINTCAAQEVNQTEKIPIISDVLSANRPVSC